MTSKMESSREFNEIYGTLAEITVADPDYRRADAGPFEDGLVTDTAVLEHMKAKEIATDVLFDTLLAHRQESDSELRWQMSRIAALKEVGNTALGSFSTYFSSLGGETIESQLDSLDLPEGEAKVIGTNTSILTVNRLYADPVEFLDLSLGIIDRSKHKDRFSIGPENYATALKFFTDKYRNLDNPAEEVSQEVIIPLVSESLQGFVDVSHRDAPNFVEMMNIYMSVHMLPKGSVEKRFTRPLLKQSIETLPDYGNASITHMLGALTKLDISEDGETAARLVNLALRKRKGLDTTYEFRVSLRAIEHLPKSAVSEQAFNAFLQYRNDLETSLTIEGADEVTARLRSIAEQVVTDPSLTIALKEVAERTARQASDLCKRSFLEGGLTSEQETQIRETFARIMNNYNAI